MKVLNSHKNLQKVYNIGRGWEKNNVKVFGQAFFKRLAVSKGGALVALRRVRNFLFRRALRKGLNLQNDPAWSFSSEWATCKRGRTLTCGLLYLSSLRAGGNYLLAA